MEEPSVKEYGAFLRYSGDVANPQWLAEQISQVPGGGVSGYVLRKQVDGYGWTPVYEVPSGGTTGSILAKNSNTSYDLTWTGNITNADIDTIMTFEGWGSQTWRGNTKIYFHRIHVSPDLIQCPRFPWTLFTLWLQLSHFSRVRLCVTP